MNGINAFGALNIDIWNLLMSQYIPVIFLPRLMLVNKFIHRAATAAWKGRRKIRKDLENISKFNWRPINASQNYGKVGALAVTNSDLVICCFHHNISVYRTNGEHLYSVGISRTRFNQEKSYPTMVVFTNLELKDCSRKPNSHLLQLETPPNNSYYRKINPVSVVLSFPDRRLLIARDNDRKCLFLLTQRMLLDRSVDWRSTCAMPDEDYINIQRMHLLGDDRLVLVACAQFITHIFVTDVACTKLLLRRSVNTGDVTFSCVTYDGWFIYGKLNSRQLHFIQLLGEDSRFFSCEVPSSDGANTKIIDMQICNDGTLVIAHTHGLLFS